MNSLVRTTLNLKQFQCQKCGEMFYMDEDFREGGLDFGCPRGCDDQARHTRTFRTEIKSVEVIEVPEGEREDADG